MENELNTQQTPNKTYQDFEENVTWDNVFDEFHDYLEDCRINGQLSRSDVRYCYSEIFLEFMKNNYKPPERK